MGIRVCKGVCTRDLRCIFVYSVARRLSLGRSASRGKKDRACAIHTLYNDNLMCLR